MRMAGIEVIDSALTKQSIDLARTHLSPYLFNHVIRSWLMSTLAASNFPVKPDPEVLACATILHDLGLTEKYEANERFEVDGANAARAFLRGHGMKERDLQLVWDSIALHTTPSIAMHKEPEVVCCLAGIGADIIGFGLERFKPEDVERINQAYPRLSIKERFKDDMCGIVKRKPHCAHGGIAADFGARYVPGFKPVSAADLVANAPYAE